MDITIIRERVQAGHYLIRSHAVIHALKEGFERKDMVEAMYIEVITAYLPDPLLWENPPLRRRKRKRK